MTMKRVAITAIRLYQQALSPYWPGICRFHPSCSQYTVDAITRYGAARGCWMGFRRILRCRPLGGQGYDPVA